MVIPEPAQEPWLRGPIPDVSAPVSAILHSFQQAREDLAKFTEGLTSEQIWARPHGFAPVGFQLRHIAGSIERLMTYVEGRQLSGEQLAALKTEMDPGATREELLTEVDRATSSAEATIRAISPETFGEPRAVGRKKLPTTVIGLLIHCAEHTQRHVGQAISAAKLARHAAVPGQSVDR